MKFESFPILETERFILRQMTQEDEQSVYELFSDGEVTKDMGEEAFNRIEQAQELIHFMNSMFNKNIAIRWGIVKKDTNTLIGTCGYNGWEIHRGSRGEIAYDLRKMHWRQGYMSEVLRRVITFGFEDMGLYRIEAFTNLDAVPSIKLLEKFGFHEDGVLRGYASFHGQFVDQRCFSLLKKEWG
ncbi:GNAT family protein [Paenibacillus sp. RC67]|uniref:GNAT family N-acetyltransferase n=1 Tax=Paenibacillus sp. RC67 TaxID=3039392 RepID=UPI0024AD08DD|nr:GNAT family protein [Paenibacillus sp. RC67]